MKDAKEILTEGGYENFIYHLKSMENALFFLMGHADDLHIGCSDFTQQGLLFKVQQLLPILKESDGCCED